VLSFFADLNHNISKINDPVMRAAKLVFSNMRKKDVIQIIELSLKAKSLLRFFEK
jgi:hypothetical protein